MKKILFIIIGLLLILTSPAIGDTESIQLQWMHGQEADLAGFRVYMGSTNVAGCPATTPVADLEYTGDSNSFTTDYQLTGNSGDMFYFRVTAYDTSGNESECSNVASYTMPDTIPPGAPYDLTIEVIVNP